MYTPATLSANEMKEVMTRHPLSHQGKKWDADAILFKQFLWSEMLPGHIKIDWFGGGGVESVWDTLPIWILFLYYQFTVGTRARKQTWKYTE